jgi:hypothetical protein
MLLCFGDTICKHTTLISIEPILEGSGGEGKMDFDIIKEVILISGEKEFGFIIDSMDFGFCLESLYVTVTLQLEHSVTVTSIIIITPLAKGSNVGFNSFGTE